MGRRQGTLGMPPLSPTMPRARTNALLMGSKLERAYTWFPLPTRNSATCRLPSSAQTPVSGTMSSNAQISVQCAVATAQMASFTRSAFSFQVAALCCVRSGMYTIVVSRLSLLTKGRNNLSFSGSFTAVFHSHW